jgi:hypothetical protein
MPLAIALEGFVPRNRSAKPAYGRRRWLGQAGVLAVGTAFFALAQARIRMSNTLAAIGLRQSCGRHGLRRSIAFEHTGNLSQCHPGKSGQHRHCESSRSSVNHFT